MVKKKKVKELSLRERWDRRLGFALNGTKGNIEDRLWVLISDFHDEEGFNEIRESPVPEDDDEKSGYARDILPGLIDDYLDFKSQVLSCGEAEF
jgi:hypothetical protein